MNLLSQRLWAIGLATLIAAHGLTFAQDSSKQSSDGQAQLDQATDLKIEAKTPDDLAKVISLAEKALAEGLDADSQSVAKELIASSAFQRAQLAMEQLLRSRASNPTVLQRLRNNMLQDLKKATENDPNLADAFLLMARIEEPTKAREALEKAIVLLKDDKEKLAKAYVMRGLLTEDAEERIANFKKATETDSSNMEARQALITVQITNGKFEEVYKDAKALMEKDPDSLFAIKAGVAALKELDRSDEALQLLGEKIEKIQDPLPLLQDRAQLYLEKLADLEGENKKEEINIFLTKALNDLDRVLDANPRNPEALLSRCRIYMQQSQFDKAERDVEDLLSIAPNQPGALYLRSMISANQKRLSEAIADMQQVVKLVPDNVSFLLQLGSYYQMDDRPKKAIQVYDQVLKSNDADWSQEHVRALRLRGDTKLSIGDHKGAVEDFEKAIQLLGDGDAEEKSGLLNNLAWVLATSPTDEIRDGKRAIELGTKACELTNFKAGHILSTLAAGYAEVGNFEEAMKWSEKAVEAGKEEGSEQVKQLQEELESYKMKKPWREKQDTKEKKAPIPAKDGVDT